MGALIGAFAGIGLHSSPIVATIGAAILLFLLRPIEKAYHAFVT